MLPVKRVSRLLLVLGLPLALLALAFTVPSRPAASNLTIYDDALGAGWNDWSWDPIDRNLANNSPVHSGSHSIAVTYTGGWSGLKLARNGDLIDLSTYDTLSFWLNGGTSGGQTVTLMLEYQGSSGSQVAVTANANTWKHIQIPLAQLEASTTIDAVDWFNNTAGAQSTFYLDDIALINAGLPTPTQPAPGVGPALAVNAAAGQHPISPDIYGMNFADQDLAADIDLPINRWGGNATTRYNWQLDISNRASDWYFENITNDLPNPAALPDGSSSDQFIDQNTATGTDSLITLPLIGWTPKGPRGDTICGFSVAKYGQQKSVDPYDKDCGNGVKTNNSDVTGNNPLDTSIAIGPSFDVAWVNYLEAHYNNGVRFYDLDNEPMLWDSTHRDVHPQPTSYDEMVTRAVAYASAIKAADPDAQLLGPVVWGWCAYFYSAADGCGKGSDYASHGNTYFMDWYLQQLHAYQQAHGGVRLLDYLDLHMYPQADGVSLSGAGSASTQALRLRSTRSLWDPTYFDESWINDYVDLIPRMKSWVANDYPGTKLSISEYNWGALDSLNGAVAEADVLGIFGREGVDLAALWSPPSFSQPGAFAFRMYRNYDGLHHEFGSESVQASSADQGQLSVYAALRGGDDALTIMVINKSLTQPLTSSLALSGYSPGPQAAVYRYSAADLGHVVNAPNQVVTISGLTATFPAQSITLFVLLPGVPLTPRDYLPLLHAQ